MTMSMGSFASRVVATAVVATDGTGDFTDIQTAIDSLPATGGVVYIKEGTYNFTTFIRITTNNIALIGAGKATKIVTTTNVRCLDFEGSSGILIKDIWFSGTGSGNTLNFGIVLKTCLNCRIESCWFDNFGAEAILVWYGGSKTILTNNHIYNNFASGIYLTADDVTVANNYIYSNTKHGIFVEDSDDCIIDGNSISDNGVDDSATYDGIILLDDSNNCVISNNRIYDNDRYEINITAATCNKNLVVGNCLVGTDHEGDMNDSGTETTIVGNNS